MNFVFLIYIDNLYIFTDIIFKINDIICLYTLDE